MDPNAVLTASTALCVLPHRAPRAVQWQQWAVQWQQACDENPEWLQMRDHGPVGPCPYCMICSQWAEIGHLQSRKCMARAEAHGFLRGPVLGTLLASEGGAPPCASYASTPPQRQLVPMPVESCVAGERCANPKCGFVVHSACLFGDYCCKTCCVWHERGYRKSKHGQKCERLTALVAGPVAPSSMPREERSSHTGGGAREVHHAGWCCRATSRAAVRAGVDLETKETGHVTSCQQVGETVLIQEAHSEGSATHARIRIRPAGWVTLAVRCEDYKIESDFHQPHVGWEAIFRNAQNIDVLWVEFEGMASDLENHQGRIREVVHNPECQRWPCLPELQSSRDRAREQALRQLRECIEVTERHCLLPGWSGGGGRELRAAEAKKQAEVLDKGVHLDAAAELQTLEAARRRSLEAKIALEEADHQLRKERLQAQLHRPTDDELQGPREAWCRARTSARAEAKAYEKRMAHLRRLAEAHAPELLPKLVELTDEKIKAELQKLSPAEQSNILEVLATDRALSHYDDALDAMRALSRKNARHKVLESKYADELCVLKMFDLADHRGLAGFFQEVELHVRLQSALVVPLQCAFLDTHYGFLHFRRYPCDLAEWIRRERSARPRQPHRLGEPMEASVVDRMFIVRRIAQAMVQSVSHLHSRRVVHGDLKPSNWLWDDNSETPLLCDFETARDRGAGGASDGVSTQVAAGTTSAMHLHTPKYTAPELLQNPTHPKTKQSDVFALGRSLQDLLQCCEANSGTPDFEQLKELAEGLLVPTPNERSTALEAEKSCWKLSREGGSGCLRKVLCKDCRLFYTQYSCGSRFKDGQPFETLIETIVRDPTYPLHDERLIIDVVKKGRALLSVDNRRLHCFLEAQKRLPRDVEVVIWIRQYQWEPIWDRYFHNLDPTNRGKDIIVRKSFYSQPKGGG